MDAGARAPTWWASAAAGSFREWLKKWAMAGRETPRTWKAVAPPLRNNFLEE